MDNKTKHIRIVLEEYKAIWSYYQKSIDERSNLFAWYFKIVTFPAALIGVTTILKTEIDIEITSYAIAGLLFVIYLTGISLHVTYAMQSSNAKKMELALIQLREYIRKMEPDLKNVLILDKLRKDNKSSKFLGTIKFWRGLVLSLINSAIIAGTVAVLIDSKYWYLIPVVYIISLLIHYFLYTTMFRNYRQISIEDIA